MGVIRRVACAVSGGVDSAVSAYLLSKKGFDVVGVYMINWDNVEEGTTTCPRTKDEADAYEVCRKLDIKCYTVNFVQEYWNHIFSYALLVNYLLKNYVEGRTVVPDILCNNIIKFDLLHKYAFEKLHVDAVATGHFVRTTCGNYLEEGDPKNGVRLLTGLDPLKDQSYFLCGLTQSQLKRSMFPVGSLIKTQVRSIAKSAGLSVWDKAESMGICFIGKRKNFSSFLDQYLEKNEGVIRNVEDGNELAKHNGIHHFNIGKRIQVDPSVCQFSMGFYVTSLDYRSKTVWACNGVNHPSLYAKEFIIKEPSWIADSPFQNSNTATVDFRCQRTHPAFRCTIILCPDGNLRVLPKNPVRAAAPGQMCVIYRGEECLGGSEILEINKFICFVSSKCIHRFENVSACATAGLIGGNNAGNGWGTTGTPNGSASGGDTGKGNGFAGGTRGTAAGKGNGRGPIGTGGASGNGRGVRTEGSGNGPKGTGGTMGENGLAIGTGA
ncbi:unnamed protein product [Enterobius vermicularis]|uniref:tRNA-5-taurinomethyluridine 2-sulfurtransferase n=1 Tax=Enterobius vermicularis TaxID=51028 RepID=A0A0N4V0L5_ENTVE|nr:unnamed protein product [Enterobius vermicularis]